VSRFPVGPGTVVLGGGAVLLITFLAVGYFLPTTWEADAEALLPASPEVVLPYLDSPEGWTKWTVWPDSIEREGPARGAGAAIRWSSPELGTGSFRIEDADPSGVRYAVRVEGAGSQTLDTRGTIDLRADGNATRIIWHEQGDLGRNPLMGYWALRMNRAQSAELAKNLDALAQLLAEPDSVPR
jgi:carbon monoxide dehydrogenase subunit G